MSTAIALWKPWFRTFLVFCNMLKTTKFPQHLTETNVHQVHQIFKAYNDKPFSWSLDITFNGDNVVLRKWNTWETFDMSELLPDDVVFSSGPIDICEIDASQRESWQWPAEIKYKPGMRKNATFLLQLLHEIWHSIDPNYLKREEKNKGNSLCTQLVRRLVKDICSSIIKWKLGHYVSLSEIKELMELERYAWSYALRKLRELKKVWWDLSGWLSDQEILEYIRVALLTYENRNNFQFSWNKKWYIQFSKKNRQ
jgi:hypothetical protein